MLVLFVHTGVRRCKYLWMFVLFGYMILHCALLCLLFVYMQVYVEVRCVGVYVHLLCPFVFVCMCAM